MNLFKNSSCSYCLKKILSKFIYCIQCKIEICVKCFCYGIEGGDHRKTHKYKIESVLRKDKFCLFKKDSKWNFEEELKLMDAVIVFKTGNWVDISLMVKTKNSEECRLHFIDHYTKSSFGRGLIKYIKLNEKLPPKNPIFDHTEGEYSPIFYEKYPISLLKPEEEKLLGLMPNRNEFILEINDNAEHLISTMEPTGDLGSVISALQTTLIDIYNRKLIRRNKIKRIACEHNFISHIIAHILDKGPRDYTFFHRQMLKRIYPAHSIFSFPTPTSIQRHKSLFGRVYMRRQRSFTTDRSNDSNSIELSTPTPSEVDNSCHTTVPSFPFPASQGLLTPIQTYQQIEDHPSWHYNAFSIKEELRPFLQYLTADTTKQFLENMKKEEQLRSEILTLQKCVKHGILSYEDYKEKLADHNSKNKNKTKIATVLREDIKLKSHTKRKRGKSRNFGFNRMLRRRRLKKYLSSLENRDT